MQEVTNDAKQMIDKKSQETKGGDGRKPLARRAALYEHNYDSKVALDLKQF